MAGTAAPETLTIPTPPRPGGVAIAAMVSPEGFIPAGTPARGASTDIAPWAPGTSVPQAFAGAGAPMVLLMYHC